MTTVKPKAEKAGKYTFYAYQISDGQQEFEGTSESKGRGEFSGFLETIQGMKQGQSILIDDVPTKKIQSLRIFVLGQKNKETKEWDKAKVPNPTHWKIDGKKSGTKTIEGEYTQFSRVFVAYHVEAQEQRKHNPSAEAKAKKAKATTEAKADPEVAK